jgi:peptide-methionine (S)-S-oxide reductase
MITKLAWVFGVMLAIAILYCVLNQPEFVMPENFPKLEVDPAQIDENAVSIATFGNGCFWCTEAVFQQLKGVKSVKSGYSGGTVKNPSYYEVCSESTGHAEAIQITYDPSIISYPELLEVFWRSHDPTTLNRQGNDVGTQYRSVIFTHTPAQQELAEKYKAMINEANVFPNPVVTEIVPFTEFYVAEANHQNFYADNPNQGYCRVMIRPKLEKLKKIFGEKVK